MYSIIQELESNNSRLFKEDVIKREAEANNDLFFEGCRLALDPLVSFGVKQVPQAEKDGPGCSWEQFNELATKLSNRSATGHAARDLIEFHMNISTKSEWNDWYRRILIKDLRCGVSEKTINNVVKKVNKDLFMFLVFLWGVCGGIAMPMSRTLMQQLAPPDQRARVMSFYAFSFMGAGPLGTLFCGYLADLFGPQFAIVISAACMLAVLAMISLSSPLWRSELQQIQPQPGT